MSMYNILKCVIRCPRCGNTSNMDVEFRFGLLDLGVYVLGDIIKWSEGGRGLRYPQVRPDNGNYTGEGYAMCPVCQKDFWLTITIKADYIECADVDINKSGYIQ